MDDLPSPSGLAVLLPARHWPVLAGPVECAAHARTLSTCDKGSAACSHLNGSSHGGLPSPVKKLKRQVSQYTSNSSGRYGHSPHAQDRVPSPVAMSRPQPGHFLKPSQRAIRSSFLRLILLATNEPATEANGPRSLGLRPDNSPTQSDFRTLFSFPTGGETDRAIGCQERGSSGTRQLPHAMGGALSRTVFRNHVWVPACMRVGLSEADRSPGGRSQGWLAIKANAHLDDPGIPGSVFDRDNLCLNCLSLVGAAGLEPATSCSQSTRASQAALRPVGSLAYGAGTNEASGPEG